VQTAITRLYTHWGKARNASNLNAYTRTPLIRVFLTERSSAQSRRIALTDSGTVDDQLTSVSVEGWGRLRKGRSSWRMRRRRRSRPDVGLAIATALRQLTPSPGIP
jgi:hypothetical protein